MARLPLLCLSLVILWMKCIGSVDHDATALQYWEDVPMPTKSYFAGFEAPDDEVKWRKAVLQTQSGKQVLLEAVLKIIKCPGDLLSGEKKFKWIHRMVDVFVSRKTGFEEPMKNFTGYRAPITMLGFKTFDRKDWEGSETKTFSYGPDDLIAHLQSGKLRIPRRFVGVGNMDENWGWISTHFLNRTASWGFTINRKNGPMNAMQLEEMLPLLDNPKLIMLLVNQHHNVSHPKVVSLPRGVLPNIAKIIWDEAQHTTRLDIRKNTLLFSASSTWGPRPYILDCVNGNMGGHLKVNMDRMDNIQFMKALASSMAVLCVPGLGYDTFRLWEALASGSMPVLERGVGFDRSLYKLPALLVDDFADVTPFVIRQAYVEAIYRADSWDYKRITTRWWERLLYKVSETGSISHLLRLHPTQAEDVTFTRPMVPFDCKAIGGCGHGTKRVPSKSCAIDFSLNMSEHNWYWEQKLIWPGGERMPEHRKNKKSVHPFPPETKAAETSTSTSSSSSSNNKNASKGAASTPPPTPAVEAKKITDMVGKSQVPVADVTAVQVKKKPRHRRDIDQQGHKVTPPATPSNVKGISSWLFRSEESSSSLEKD